MKFEKFFKSAGIFGHVVKTINNRWLICNGVGMKIPGGVNTLDGTEDPDEIFKAILNADLEDDLLDLVRAELPADGKPTDIRRIFATAYGDEVAISNACYGLLEKGDRLVYCEIEDDEEEIRRFILVTDGRGEEVVGFIAETE